MIAQEIGDNANKGYWLGNLGDVYSDLKDYKKATGYYEQAIEISKSTIGPNHFDTKMFEDKLTIAIKKIEN